MTRAFSKSFTESFNIAQQKAADASTERLKAKLKEESEVNRENRQLEREREKNKALAKKTFGDILTDDDINDLAGSGATIEDIREAASVKQSLAAETRDADFSTLQNAVEKIRLAGEQGFSAGLTDDERAAAQRQNINPRLESAAERLRQRVDVSPDTQRLLDVARFPKKAVFEQEERQITADEDFREKEFNLREREFDEIKKMSFETSQALQKLALKVATREEAESTAPSTEQRAAAGEIFEEESFFEPATGGTGERSRTKQVRNLFKSVFTPVFGGPIRGLLEAFGDASREVTFEDADALARIADIRNINTLPDTVKAIKEGGVTEQKLRGFMLVTNRDRKSALKLLQITEEQVNKTFSR